MPKKNAQIENPDANAVADATPGEATVEVKAEKTRKTKMAMASEKTTSRRAVLKDARQRELERELVRSEKEQFLSGWSSLETAMRRETVLYGVVAGIEEVATAGTEKAKERVNVALAVLYENRYRILIPFDEIYHKNPVDMATINISTKEGVSDFIRRQKQMASKLLGATIPFAIKHMFAGKTDILTDYSIGGSRKAAIERIAKSNYTPDRNGYTAITVGTRCDGFITSVGQFSVSMSVGGVDVQVPLRKLTFKHILDLRDEFSVGQIVPVDIDKVEFDSDGNVDLVLVDAKPPQLERAQRKQHLLPIGTNCVGVVTLVKESSTSPGKIVMTAYLPQYDMPAFVSKMPPARRGQLPQSGDELGLIVTGFTDKGYVITSCHRFLGSAGYLLR